MYRFWLRRKVCDSSCTRVANARCLFRRTPISEEISPALLRSMLEDEREVRGRGEGEGEGEERERRGRGECNDGEKRVRRECVGQAREREEQSSKRRRRLVAIVTSSPLQRSKHTSC